MSKKFTDEEKKKQIDEMTCKIFEYICAIEPDEEKRVQLLQEEAASFVTASVDIYGDNVFNQVDSALNNIRKMSIGGIIRFRSKDESRVLSKVPRNDYKDNKENE